MVQCDIRISVLHRLKAAVVAANGRIVERAYRITDGGQPINRDMRGGGDNRSRETRVNERIRAREVRVIDEEGQMLGVMTSLAALNLARERNLDLVEVQPMANPPVCKILDWGRFKYEQSKKENEARKHQKVMQLREIRMKPRTGDHDVDVKVRKILEFLGEGDKVKVSVSFRGRELAHPELGRVLLEQVTQSLKGAAQIERTPLMEGKMLSMIVSRAPGWEPQKDQKKAAPAAEPVKPAAAPTEAVVASEPPAVARTAPEPPVAASVESASVESASSEPSAVSEPRPAARRATPRPATDGTRARTTKPPSPPIEEPDTTPATTAQ